ncbi:MAG: tetratricopeptide repeat protein [Anaerolineae bacterium]|nr:tetratricopeptide repeat protein [Anaerolineae bacterium]
MNGAGASWQVRMRAQWAYRRALWLRFLGHRMMRREFYEAATAALDRVLLLLPEFGEAYLMRGLLCWRELGQPERAVHDLTAVLDLEPDRAEVLFYRGMAHQATGDYAAAANDLRAAIEQAPRARWRANAHSQLVAIQAMLAEMSPQLAEASESLLSLGDGGN